MSSFRTIDDPQDGFIIEYDGEGKTHQIRAATAVTLLNAYERSLEDHQRHIKRLDILLNGVAGAAERPQIIDLISQLAEYVKHHGHPLSQERLATKADIVELREWMINLEQERRTNVNVNWPGPR